MRHVVIAFTLLLSSSTWAVTHNVTTAAEFRTAMQTATAGDVIHVAPGTYTFDSLVRTQNDGPVTITADDVDATRLEFDSVEGLVFYNADWTLENITVYGACTPGDCYAAVGVKQGAHRFLMQGCKLVNWVQHLKSARNDVSEVEDVSILENEFTNDDPIDGTPVDVVGGKRWRIAGNYVHDYGGSGISYGIFIKGATSDSVIERNLVVGAYDRAATGVVLGISLGGGGTGDQFCPGGTACVCEDRRSIVRNNVVAHCTDACFHTKRSCDGQFLHNVGVDCGIGLQVQNDGAEGPVHIEANVLDGRITGGNNRTEANNVLQASATLSSAYADVGAFDFSVGGDASAVQGLGADLLAIVADDYCGQARTTPTDLGPFVIGDACQVMPWTGLAGNAVVEDGGVVGGEDSGVVGGEDSGVVGGEDSGVVGGEDSGVVGDDAGVVDAGGEPEPEPEPEPTASPEPDAASDPSADGCSCDASPSTASLWMLGLLALWGWRRRRC